MQPVEDHKIFLKAKDLLTWKRMAHVRVNQQNLKTMVKTSKNAWTDISSLVELDQAIRQAYPEISIVSKVIHVLNRSLNLVI